MSIKDAYVQRRFATVRSDVTNQRSDKRCKRRHSRDTVYRRRTDHGTHLPHLPALRRRGRLLLQGVAAPPGRGPEHPARATARPRGALRRTPSHQSRTRRGRGGFPGAAANRSRFPGGPLRAQPRGRARVRAGTPAQRRDRIAARPPVRQRLPRAWSGRESRATGLADEEFLARIRSFAGYSHPALEDPEMRALLLPMLRADVELHESHRPQFDKPLSTPITAIHGLDDELVDMALIAQWERATSRRVQHRGARPGGHMYLADDPAPLLRPDRRLARDAGRALTMRLSGKTAVITGAARGLGRASARSFAAGGRGPDAAGRLRRPARGALRAGLRQSARAHRRTVPGLRRSVVTKVADVREMHDVEAAVSMAVGRFGRIESPSTTRASPPLRQGGARDRRARVVS